MNSYLPVWASAPNFEKSAIFHADWEGRERAFEVVFSYDRVYFRLQDEPKRVFAALDVCSPNEIENAFKSAISSGDFGFYFVAHNFPLFRGRFGRGPNFHLRAICHQSGVGWLREWSSPDWLWFNPQSTRVLAFAPDYLYPHDKRTFPDWFFPAVKQKRDELLFRDVTNAEFNGLITRWVRGSDKEFLRVSPLLWKAGLIRERPNQFRQYTYRGINLVHYNAENENSHLWFDYTNYVGHPKLLELLNRRLDLRGYDWAPSPYWTRKYRGFFSKFPRSRARFIQRRARRFFSLNELEIPTFHEQIEASLELRAYLEEIRVEENLSEEDLDAWCVPAEE